MLFLPFEPGAVLDERRGVLKRKTARAAVVLNAAAAIYLAGISSSIVDGVRVAEESIDTGKAIGSLDRLRRASARAEHNRPAI